MLYGRHRLKCGPTKTAMQKNADLLMCMQCSGAPASYMRVLCRHSLALVCSAYSLAGTVWAYNRGPTLIGRANVVNVGVRNLMWDMIVSCVGGNASRESSR